MRRTICAAAAFLAAIIFTACGPSSQEPKAISVFTTDFTEGNLAKWIEVVNEPCRLSYISSSNSNSAEALQLRVRVRLKQTFSEIQTKDPYDVHFTRQTAAANINLLDANGIKIQTLKLKKEENQKLIKLLQSDGGSVAELVFEEIFSDEKNVGDWFEQCTQLSPAEAADIKFPKSQNKPEVKAGPERHRAVIHDVDGYTNVRASQSSSSNVVKIYYDGEQFFYTTIPGSNWVNVYESETGPSIGYMYGNRVARID